MATATKKPRKRTRKEADQNAERMRGVRAAARDLVIPKRENARRRNATKRSLVKFKETYFKHLAYLKPAPFMIDRLKEMQQAVLAGAQDARAEPRGSAKTTDALIAAMWALCHGHKKFFFIIKCNNGEAQQVIKDFKHEAETNDLLLADFPEIFLPMRALEGAPQRAGRQTVKGERTRMEYTQNFIVFPTVKGSKASGAVLACSGIDGAIRGTRINNKRPDFVLLDDIETRESVASKKTTQNIETKITSDVAGLGGPGVAVAMMFRGTILTLDCIIARYTDRHKKPEWRGRRTKALIQWPTRMDLWKKYWRIKSDGIVSGEDPNGHQATKFYMDAKDEMEDGAIVAWPDNFIRDKVDGRQLEFSNIQHLMNKIWSMGMAGFLSEYQNEPEPVLKTDLEVDEITERLNGQLQHRCQDGWRLVQFIDVRKTELHYVTLALAPDMTGHIIDYGIKFLREVAGSSLDPNVRPALERAIVEGLKNHQKEMAQFPYQTISGRTAPVELTLVDSNWYPDPVYQFVQDSGARFRATKGEKSIARMKAGKPDKTTKHGHSFVAKYDYQLALWLFHLDADNLKHSVHNRLKQGSESPGAFTLFGNNPQVHVDFANHMLAEVWNEEKNRWDKVSPDNHFFDCLAGCIAAAEMIGIRIVDLSPSRNRKPIDLAEAMGKTKRRRGRR